MSEQWTKCDVGGCNARSYVTVTIDTLDILDFCGHHYKALEEDLMPYEIGKDDRRAKLREKVTSSA